MLRRLHDAGLVRSGDDRDHEDHHINTAWLKGLAGADGRVEHAFNACLPVITVLGLQFGQLLGGAIVTETVFAWPGVATLTVDSIRNQDFPVVQCAVVLLALIIVAVNFLVEMLGGPHRSPGSGSRRGVPARTTLCSPAAPSGYRANASPLEPARCSTCS